MSANQLPAEIVEKILEQLWFSDLSPAERILLMTTCPRLNSTWKSQFSRIASITIHIPCLHYLLYLAEIVRTGKSLVYDRHSLRKGARTMICFLDLRERGVDSYSYRQHKVLIDFVIHDPETVQPFRSLVHTEHSSATTLESPPLRFLGHGRQMETRNHRYILGRLPDRPKNESHPIPDPFTIRKKIRDGLHLHGREIRTSHSTVFHEHDLSEADDFWGINRRLYIAGTSTPSSGSFATHLYHRIVEARLRYEVPDILGYYREGRRLLGRQSSFLHSRNFSFNSQLGPFATHLYHRVKEAWLRYKVPDILENYGKGVSPQNPLCAYGF
ncbi:hypothetical protein BT96DRAFT_972960 [Gymnopus androsaceus JB14]|uniref:F-box domain-containing protein n=1 Tax=Gymnopus androsaceus JB14 TaxID=1447944 RepID=A0A6A4I1W6_9AGAR|nr:hypothetical protein BT96DRAFT_972960 [Gymnopus androsaceus JB14]